MTAGLQADDRAKLVHNCTQLSGNFQTDVRVASGQTVVSQKGGPPCASGSPCLVLSRLAERSGHTVRALRIRRGLPVLGVRPSAYGAEQ